ncbi:MAG TPA: DUF5671 domain-containing protein [Parcubacteria group bacterium]|jgi:hypothetical protein|nr:DUF5671 domain-containing protein [Parcubacteria group bacterium]
MEPTQNKNNVKDFFINLGATVSLYTVVGSLINLLFSVINKAYPQVTSSYYYSGSISWPVSVLVIFFPIFLALMWLLGKEYDQNPGSKSAVHKWLTYLTLFIAGLVLAGNLIAVLYYFIDGRELTTAFLLKALVLLVITGSIFYYYISDVRNLLTPKSRNLWRIFAFVLVLSSIIWGFSVLGSPRTQRLYKYDAEKINGLQNMKGQIEAYYGTYSKLPLTTEDLKSVNFYGSIMDTQTNTPFEYIKTGDITYKLCAVFNKESSKEDQNYGYTYYYGDTSWSHPSGKHCFDQKINTLMYPKAQF